MKEQNQNAITFVAKLDLYEHPETGAELVAAYPEDGEEYVITNKKMVKKLMKYVEDDIDITFEGIVTEDPYAHIKILNVKSFKAEKEPYELKPIDTPEDLDEHKHARKRKNREEDFEDEDFQDEDFDLDEIPENLDEQDGDEEEEDVEGNLDDMLDIPDYEDIEFDEEIKDDDISEDEKQNLMAKLNEIVSPKNK